MKIWKENVLVSKNNMIVIFINMKIIYRPYIKKMQLLFVNSDVGHMLYL